MGERKKGSAIVIGTGIGGTAIAALLSHKGFDVTILEKLTILGGRCCSRGRDGFVIDLGVHTISMGGAGPLGDVLRRCGVQNADQIVSWSPARNPTQKLWYLGKTVEYPRGIAELGANMDDYARLMKAIVSMSAPDVLGHDHVSLRDFILGYTQDKILLNIFAYISELYFLAPYWSASAGEFIRSMQAQAQKRASGYPVGGCRVIPQSYLDVVQAHGGTVRARAGVRSILVESGRAVGVELENGEILKADLVISNADPQTTVRLAGVRHFPADYLAKIQSLKFSGGAYVIKIALKEPITSEKFIMSIAHPDADEYYSLVEENKVPETASLMIPITSNLDPGSVPEGRQLIIAGALPAMGPHWDKWHDAVMRGVQAVFPGLENHVLFTEDTTPDDVDKLVGEAGSVIGLMQTIDQVGALRLGQKTPVENLFFVGAEAGGWGIGTELAANSALELADMLLGLGA